MTMQSALERARELNVCARPARGAKYSYRYVQHGQDNLIHVQGRDKRGTLQSGVWRTLTQRELEDDWVLCDQDGKKISNPTEAAKRGPSLSGLMQETAWP